MRKAGISYLDLNIMYIIFKNVVSVAILLFD